MGYLLQIPLLHAIVPDSEGVPQDIPDADASVHSRQTRGRAGVPRNVVMTITGHTANDMNFRYDTVDENDLLKAVDQIEAYLESVDQKVDQVELEN